MGKIMAGMASSHAYALVEPTGWDVMRGRTRARYKARYGVEPELHPNIADETPDVRERGYRHIREALAFFERRMRETRPDAVIIVGDDQDENFTEENLPQIAVYTGAEIYTTERASDGSRLRGPRYPCHAELAHDLLGGLVDREFDVASCSTFPKDELLSHAHGPIMRRVLPDADIPVVPVFVNAIHVPAPSPRRCYRLGVGHAGDHRKPARETSGWPYTPRAACPISPRDTRGNTTRGPMASGPSARSSTGRPWSR